MGCAGANTTCGRGPNDQDQNRNAVGASRCPWRNVRCRHGVSAVVILREPLDALSAVTLAFIIVAILTAAVFVPAVIVTIYHDYTNERDT